MGVISWRVAAGTAFTLLLTIAGYTFQSVDGLTRDNQAEIQRTHEHIAAVDTDLQQEKVRTAIRDREIERRLAELQTSLTALHASVDDLKQMLLRRQFR